VNEPPAIGFAGWAFLVFAGLALPLAAALFAVGERRRDDSARGDVAGNLEVPSRVQLYRHALVTHALLLAAALAAARVEGIRLFPRAAIGLRDGAAAALTLLAVLAVAELSWRVRSPAARERLWIRRIVPQTYSERRMWIVVSGGAAVAEEIAYRGVFVACAAAATASGPAAVIASAIAFAATHAPQGYAGVSYVFVIALLHQALVLVTGTLLPAIVVHFLYDVLAGLWLARRHGLAE